MNLFKVSFIVFLVSLFLLFFLSFYVEPISLTQDFLCVLDGDFVSVSGFVSKCKVYFDEYTCVLMYNLSVDFVSSKDISNKSVELIGKKSQNKIEVIRIK